MSDFLPDSEGWTDPVAESRNRFGNDTGGPPSAFKPPEILGNVGWHLPSPLGGQLETSFPR
jgi:hypothetical protein